MAVDLALCLKGDAGGVPCVDDDDDDDSSSCSEPPPVVMVVQAASWPSSLFFSLFISKGWFLLSVYFGVLVDLVIHSLTFCLCNKMLKQSARW